MALGSSVEDSLKDAEASLRNALNWASRTEPSYVLKSISSMITEIDFLMKTDALLDKLEQRKDGDSGLWGPNVDM